ncbi:MAG: glutamyl-tRNA synthetase, partial [Actinomycetota bacterium]|nr:glutamyl-tRNA synthetase [Actinomycetota bacterium]
GDDQEILPWDQIAQRFRIEDVTPSPAFFDEAKLRAFNGEYIRALSVPEFVAACRPWLTGEDTPWKAEDYDPAVFETLAPLAQTRTALLSDVVPMVDHFFLPEPPSDEPSWAKAMKGDAVGILDDMAAACVGADWTVEALKETLEQVGAARGMKLGKVQAPVRVAVTGRRVGLPLFESLEVLGRERTLERLRAAADRLR